MKRLLSAIIIAIMAITGLSAAGNGSAAIAFDTERHDFGNINENGGKATTEFVFHNTGDAPLVIISVTTSCGCTKPDYPKRPVAPGDSAAIKVAYNPKGRPGEFSKVIKVTTNDPSHEVVKLRITGVVIPKKK